MDGKRPTGIGEQRLGEGGSATSPLFERFVASASEGREAVYRALVICLVVLTHGTSKCGSPVLP